MEHVGAARPLIGELRFSQTRTFDNCKIHDKMVMDSDGSGERVPEVARYISLSKAESPDPCPLGKVYVLARSWEGKRWPHSKWVHCS